MTIGNATGSNQIAGAPSCAPHSPTATIASTWSSPEIGCRKPVRKPSPALLDVCEGRRAERPAKRDRSDRRTWHWHHRSLRHQHETLDRPERARASRPYSRERLTHRGQRTSSTRKERSIASTNATNPSCPISTPTLNRGAPAECPCRGKPRGQPAGEAEAVQQAEANATTHG